MEPWCSQAVRAALLQCCLSSSSPLVGDCERAARLEDSTLHIKLEESQGMCLHCIHMYYCSDVNGPGGGGGGKGM